MSCDNRPARPYSLPVRRFLPLLVLVVLAAAGFVLLRGVGWDSLARHQSMLTDWVGTHPIGSAALFLLAYILTAALSLPQAALLTVAGGLLFGALLGCVLTVTGATIGASILLVVVRSAFAQTLDRHRDRIPTQVQTRLARDGFSYLLALRLVPLFPFWIVNLAAAVAGIRLAVFFPATLLGIAPASFVLSSIGAGVGAILAEGRTPDLSVLFSARILLPLLGLAVLSLLPALLRRRPGAHA
ncbi:MAG: VTT domain-containing protein [Rhodopila sp.]